MSKLDECIEYMKQMKIAINSNNTEEYQILGTRLHNRMLEYFMEKEQ